MENIEHKLTIEHLQALFEGKKLVLDYHGQPQVTIYPPNYGKFLPYEDYKTLMRILGSRDLTESERAMIDMIFNPAPHH